MNIVFMGTPEFAVPSLHSLMRDHKILAVVTAPDKPGGRGHLLISSPMKIAAQKLNIPVLQPKNLKSPKFLERLSRINADIFVVVAFRMLPEIVWSLPKLGTINLHASILPKLRGAAPIQRAIMNGEKTSGLTVFRLNNQIDTGDIIGMCTVSIGEDETGGEIHDKMMLLGSELLSQSISKLESGSFNLIKQDDSQASEAPKLFRSDCEIDWHQNVDKVYNHIRALIPYPCAWFQHDNQTYKIYECRKIKEHPLEEPGFFVIRNLKLIIACSDGYIDVLKIQPNGKRVMKAIEFINGFQSRQLNN